MRRSRVCLSTRLLRKGLRWGGALWEPEDPLTSGARAPFQAEDCLGPFFLFFLLPLLRGLEGVFCCWAGRAETLVGQSAAL